MKLLRRLHSVKSRVLRRTDLFGVYQKLRTQFGDQKWWPGETPFEIIVGAILTQNTSWRNVEKAIANLKQADSLNSLALQKIPVEELAQLIRPAGYFNVKARRLKNFTGFLFQEFGGDLEIMFAIDAEELRARLLNVNGIGRETADSILLYAGAKPFFVIDAYTKRIFSRHRISLFRSANAALQAGYESWRLGFETSLPRDPLLYNDFHAQIVRLGKNYCKASKAHCETCPLRGYL